jgi:hypothetical protein
MDGEHPRPDVQKLASTADRLDVLAETAELMGDGAGADRFREQASDCRMRAMSILDTRD